MITTEATPALDRLLEPVTRCLTPDALRQLVNLHADPGLQERLESLADKSTEGQLTADEREEYETYVRAIHVISILQAKTRKLLAAQPAQQMDATVRSLVRERAGNQCEYCGILILVVIFLLSCNKTLSILTPFTEQ